ncbi:MAG: alpha/beta hydrolase family protein, partial [Candidatus Krumholzibacteriota bacterium]
FSPSTYAANFKTPCLVVHGENDFRVPYTQGLQLFTALQRQGVESRLLYYPDEDHFVRKPLNAELWWGTIHGWFEKYLK